MFEKEAEEYFETECLHSYADTEEQLKEDVVPAFVGMTICKGNKIIMTFENREIKEK